MALRRRKEVSKNTLLKQCRIDTEKSKYQFVIYNSNSDNSSAMRWWTNGPTEKRKSAHIHKSNRRERKEMKIKTRNDQQQQQQQQHQIN